MMKVVIESLQEMSKRSPDKEICGIIGSDMKIYPITNVASSAGDFVFDRGEYFRLLRTFQAENKCVHSVYHSHPFSSPSPSRQDLECQQRLEKDFLIVTNNSYRWVPYVRNI